MKYLLSKLGFGFLYLLLGFPQVHKCKIGITGFHIGVEKRAKQVSDSLRGVWIPVFAVPLPFVWYFEQSLHWLFEPFNRPYKRGDGRTEIFIFPTHIPTFLFMCGFWFFEIWGVDLIFGTRFAEMIAIWLMPYLTY